jgi:hypothetical protein
MKLNAWTVLAAGALLAGCGNESPSAGAKPDKTPAAAGDQAGDVALRYVRAIADKDWKAACATRVDSEQREMAKLAGSREKGFAAIFRDKPTDLFKDVEVGDVRAQGDRAEVDLTQPGQTEPATTLIATKAGSEWRLIDD